MSPTGALPAVRSTRLPVRMSARKWTHPPPRRSTPSATPCRAKTAWRAALSPPEAAKRTRAAPATKGASFGVATNRLKRCVRKRFVLGAMEQRMAALGFVWADVTATQVYTVFDIHPLLADEIVRRGASRDGLTCISRAPGARPRFRDGCTPRRMRIRDLTLRLRLRVGALQKHLAQRERREPAQAPWRR